MTAHTIKVPRPSDNTIIELFTDMSRNYGMPDINLCLGATDTTLLKIFDSLEIPKLLKNNNLRQTS